MECLDSNKFTPKQFASLRGQLEYIASGTRPDVAFSLAKLSQVKSEEARNEHAKSLNSAIRKVKSDDIRILFPVQDLESVCFRSYSDAAFANSSDLKSQLGIVIVLIDKYYKAAAIHYASWKSRRVVRSVLAAELYAFVSCHDYCQTLAHDLNTITGRRFPVHLMTDSKSIFNTITKLSGVSEKRLLIDIAYLRQSYSCGQISNTGHVISKFNIADALTKPVKASLLHKT